MIKPHSDALIYELRRIYAKLIFVKQSIKVVLYTLHIVYEKYTVQKLKQKYEDTLKL